MFRHTVVASVCLFSVALVGCDEPAAFETGSEPTHAAGKADGLFGDDDVVFADLSNSTTSVERLALRGRLIEVELESLGDPRVTPISQVVQADLEREEVSLVLVTADARLELGTAKTDDEGYLDLFFDVSDLDLAPGFASVDVVHDDEVVGSSRAVLLDKDETSPVLRVDIDLTYLDTSFHGAVALATLMSEDAFDKKTLPAMATVLQRLRGDVEHPLTFLSASPNFFKHTLESKMVLDGVEHDGLVLKPFRDAITTSLLDLETASIVADLQEEVGYKLSTLLRMRLELPAATPEILLGDDSEADFVAYNIYSQLLSGALAPEDLPNLLLEIGVRTGYRETIAALLPAVLAMHPAAPQAIYIRATEQPGTAHDIADWSMPTLHHHDGTWPLVLDLFEEALLDTDDVLDVRDELLDSGQTPEALDAIARAASFLDPETVTKFGPG